MKIKRCFFKIAAVSLSLFIVGNSYAQWAVFDAGAIAEAVEEYGQLVQIYTQMMQARQFLNQLNGDSLKWMSVDFRNYFDNITKLKSEIEKVNDILSSDNNRVLDQFNTLYPGYNGDNHRNYEDDYKNRSSKLLTILENDIQVANDALANQKDINMSDKSSEAAVANLTLASLSNLNTQMASEIRSANAYRARKVQNEVDKKQELKNFIGQDHKKRTNYKSCVGECP